MARRDTDKDFVQDIKNIIPESWYLFIKHNRIPRYICKAIIILIRNGPISLLRATKSKMYTKKPRAKTYISKKRKNFERSVVFDYAPLISVLVPLYNTPSGYLEEMIRSVRGQTYANWELCLADGSDSQHPNVQKIVDGSFSFFF